MSEQVPDHPFPQVLKDLAADFDKARIVYFGLLSEGSKYDKDKAFERLGVCKLELDKALRNYIDNQWSGPHHCVQCGRMFDDETRPVMLGLDAYCSDCWNIMEVVKEE